MGVNSNPDTSDFHRGYDLTLTGQDLFALTKGFQEFLDRNVNELLDHYGREFYESAGTWISSDDVEFESRFDRHRVINWTTTWEKVQFGYRNETYPYWLDKFDKRVAEIIRYKREDEACMVIWFMMGNPLVSPPE
jgi:hypothetical protein